MINSYLYPKGWSLTYTNGSGYFYYWDNVMRSVIYRRPENEVKYLPEPISDIVESLLLYSGPPLLETLFQATEEEFDLIILQHKLGKLS